MTQKERDAIAVKVERAAKREEKLRRDQRILELYAEGLSVPTIVERMGAARNTVRRALEAAGALP